MASRVLLIRLLAIAAWLIQRVSADNSTNATITDIIPELANNDDYIPRSNTLIGGQNFTWCCTKAIVDSLIIDGSGNLQLVDDPVILDLNISTLLAATDHGQFPCNAKYDGHQEGAPEVKVKYSWLANTCSGWQISSGSNLNAWLQPLSGFLLPAVIFCLSVPRRRKFHVARAFFVADLAGIKSYVPAFFGAIMAMVIVTLDIIFWLSICFAFAGPMILSGLYEAMLDNRVIDFVREKMENQRLTLDMRCRLLMLVLIGNLDLALDEPLPNADVKHRQSEPNRHRAVPCPSPGRARSSTVDSEGKLEPRGRASQQSSVLPRVETPEINIPLDHISSGSEGAVGEICRTASPTDYLGISSNESVTRQSTSIDHTFLHPSGQVQSATPDIRINQYNAFRRQPTDEFKASPWRHMEELLYPIGLYNDEDTMRSLSPRQYAKHDFRCRAGISCTDQNHIEKPKPRTDKYENQARKTKTRLRTMLHCQYAFGSIVGAPVVFFLGGFIFALVQSLSSIGDEDIALSLAFGQWYMTIPHIAIISGLLLAGNNPNILEGVFAKQRQDEDDDIKILGLRFGLAYPSCYKTAWQWHRGHNKKLWIKTLIETYRKRHHAEHAGQHDEDTDMQVLHERTTFSLLDWFLILFLTSLLLGVPFVLAFITAYYTPEVGLSCRSFTFTIYAIVEFAQVVLWLWAYAGPPRTTASVSRWSLRHPLDVFRRGGWLDRHDFYSPTSFDHFLAPRTKPGVVAIWHGMTSTQFRDIRSVWCVLWYTLSLVFGIISIFAALGGTLMQLMGVYSADICYIPIKHWVHPYADEVTAVISSNSQLMIRDAQTYWVPCAITAIVFMTVVSFVGWWYQRRMRDLFTELVRNVDNSKYDREDAARTRKSQPTRGDEGSLWGSPGI